MGKTNSKKKVGSDDVAQAAPPVMMEEEEPQEEEPQEEEAWDVIKVIGDSKEEACDCRTEGCGAKAVAIWQSTLDPHGEDPWPLCEPCQKIDFPDEEVQPSATTTTVTTTESKPEASVAAAVDEAGTTDGTATKEIDGKGITVTTTENAEADAGDDAWDLKKILARGGNHRNFRSSATKRVAISWPPSFGPPARIRRKSGGAVSIAR